ncbi:hypothetical protein RJZ56_006242 [Blastomyces dermatitidis]|uniref:Uncharacterized protein n=1 Tax=Blastomyces gilchristii (strain SLH14081) TaxID=559298 RepID=A0A179UTI0_BLAGS|nr:uncharacterized protein BDBG_06846 [Blastomyces gilchristii SLH14081]EQL33155.1 hypothetical protein BDFG_04763 [Blastomyces dermatitidis ATCC 26199]OAT11334.1 hypothetical protein BDBG_06846 [Blastomyces gilchristii SLH14081]
MPAPSNQRGNIDPPPEVMQEALKGFFTGATRYGSISLLAHLILLLPHPLRFASSPSPSNASSTPTTSSSHSQPEPKPRPPPRTPLLYRPLTALSANLAPMSRVYRGLTPQFKVFIQLSAMTLGGCIWAEKRVNEYLDLMRKVKRAERVEAEAEVEGWR